MDDILKIANGEMFNKDYITEFRETTRKNAIL